MDHQTIRIALVDYGEAQKAALFGTQDLLEAANLHAAEMGLSHIRFAVEQIVLNDALPEGAYHALVCPPRLRTDPPSVSAAGLHWLAGQHQQGAVVCSVCAGAFVLAMAGLLSGRTITTHWQLKDPFEAAFPDVTLDIEKLVIDDGDIVTGGGVMAWTDMALHLIERFMSPAIMLSVARQFVMEPGQREQRYFSSFAPHLGHSNQSILKVQHHLQKHYSTGHSVEALADLAGMAPRTFQRYFKQLTGMTPIAYLQNLRVEKARHMLELSHKNFNEIAWEVGYEDPVAFRKIFKRIIGLGPKEYRHRFGAGDFSKVSG